MTPPTFYTSRAPFLVALWRGSIPCGQVAASLSIALQNDGLVSVSAGWLALTGKGIAAALFEMGAQNEDPWTLTAGVPSGAGAAPLSGPAYEVKT